MNTGIPVVGFETFMWKFHAFQLLSVISFLIFDTNWHLVSSDIINVKWTVKYQDFFSQFYWQYDLNMFFTMLIELLSHSTVISWDMLIHLWQNILLQNPFKQPLKITGMEH